MSFFNRRNIVITSVFILTLLTAVFCLSVLSSNQTGSAEGNNIKIVLDAGHGGIDGGVCGVISKTKESLLNLTVVKKIEKYLVDAGFDVYLTRNTDAGLYGSATNNLKKKDMQKRKEIIERVNPTLVVSVHMNYYCLKSACGPQVFFNQENDYSKKLAESIQSSFNDMERVPKKGTAKSGDYFIVKCTKYPSVICECGFLSNSQEEALLLSDSYQEDIAYAIFKGIIGYLSQESFAFCY